MVRHFSFKTNRTQTINKQQWQDTQREEEESLLEELTRMGNLSSENIRANVVE
jgi:hypothetical protein